jgi:GNAT superfamily N-acetyltransferase
MLELKPAQYTLVRPLFKAIPYLRAVVFANLDGPQLGRVFVDHLPDPSAAFIWSDALYLVGAHDLIEFNQDFKHFVITEAFLAKEHLLFYPFTADCFACVMTLFQEYDITSIVRTGFTFDAAFFHTNQSKYERGIPDGFELRRIDKSFDASKLGIIEVWGDLATFYACGIGYAMLHEGTPVSSCISIFLGGGHAEIALSTQESYRRRGLAFLTASAVIEECLVRGLTPDWQCYYNPPSEALAIQLGFTDKTEIQIPYLHVPERFRVDR